MTKKTAGSAMVFLTEELGDARLLCDQLMKLVDRATQLVEQSEKKDHIFEVAGDIVQELPETVSKLHSALQAVALATNRLDYEEVKQELRPEKAEELEKVLEDVRIRPVRRQSSMKPAEAIQKLRTLAARTKEEGRLPLVATLDFIADLEEGSRKTASDAASVLESFAVALETPPKVASEGPSRARLAAALRQLVAAELSIAELKQIQKALEDILVEAKKEGLKEVEQKAKDALKKIKVASAEQEKEARFEKGKPADPTQNMSEEDAAEWKAQNDEHKDKFKTASDEDEKTSRFEEGKPADPTENMDKDDAKEWKSNTDKYEDKFKAAAKDDDKTSRFEKGKPADPTKEMSPEDAKEWKENTEEHKDDFKKSAADEVKWKKDDDKFVAIVKAKSGKYKFTVSPYKMALGGAVKFQIHCDTPKKKDLVYRKLDTSAKNAKETAELYIKALQTPEAEDGSEIKAPAWTPDDAPAEKKASTDPWKV